jgi:hypothetical protein
MGIFSHRFIGNFTVELLGIDCFEERHSFFSFVRYLLLVPRLCLGMLFQRLLPRDRLHEIIRIIRRQSLQFDVPRQSLGTREIGFRGEAFGAEIFLVIQRLSARMLRPYGN